jgi:hypothetical protein
LYAFELNVFAFFLDVRGHVHGPRQPAALTSSSRTAARTQSRHGLPCSAAWSLMGIPPSRMQKAARYHSSRSSQPMAQQQQPMAQQQQIRLQQVRCRYDSVSRRVRQRIHAHSMLLCVAHTGVQVPRWSLLVLRLRWSTAAASQPASSVASACVESRTGRMATAERTRSASRRESDPPQHHTRPSPARSVPTTRCSPRSNGSAAPRRVLLSQRH